MANVVNFWFEYDRFWTFCLFNLFPEVDSISDEILLCLSLASVLALASVPPVVKEVRMAVHPILFQLP